MDARRYWPRNPGSFELFEEQALDMMGFAPEITHWKPSFERPRKEEIPSEPAFVPEIVRSLLLRSSRRFVTPFDPHSEVYMSAGSPAPFVSMKPDLFLSFSRGYFLPADFRSRDEYEHLRTLGTDQALWQNVPRDYVYPEWNPPTEQQVRNSIAGLFSLNNGRTHMSTLYRYSANLRGAVALSSNVASWREMFSPSVYARLEFDKETTSARAQFNSAGSSTKLSFLQNVWKGISLGSEYASSDTSSETTFGARWCSERKTTDGAEPLAETTIKLSDSGAGRVTAVTQIPLPWKLANKTKMYPTIFKVGGVAEGTFFSTQENSAAGAAGSSRPLHLIGAAQLKTVVGDLEQGGTPIFVRATVSNRQEVGVTLAARFFNKFAVAARLLTSFASNRSGVDSPSSQPSAAPVQFKITVDL
eukprot:TRINITY_DN4194_c0_g2_i1.p1 TRINITY_DN4194_c0_g2~~TRINITY_DN4194_c0_g2_i1.p1  ORF type:complete len:424 (-),score=63.07 TRINITY_DN4194_c0_g2_i1:520-1767(-)